MDNRLALICLHTLSSKSRRGCAAFRRLNWHTLRRLLPSVTCFFFLTEVVKRSGNKRNGLSFFAASEACFWLGLFFRIPRSFNLTFVDSKMSTYLGLIFFSIVFLKEKSRIIEGPPIICYLFGENKCFFHHVLGI